MITSYMQYKIRVDNKMNADGSHDVLLAVVSGDAFFCEKLREVDQCGAVIWESTIPFLALLETAIKRIENLNHDRG